MLCLQLLLVALLIIMLSGFNEHMCFVFILAGKWMNLYYLSQQNNRTEMDEFCIVPCSLVLFLLLV